MIYYLPKEVQEQVLKNRLYLDSIHKVRVSEKNKLFNFIMKNGKLPKITASGYILCEVISD